MSKFILVYNVNEYPDARVAEVMPEHEIFAVGELDLFEYKAVEKITKIERVS